MRNLSEFSMTSHILYKSAPCIKLFLLKRSQLRPAKKQTRNASSTQQSKLKSSKSKIKSFRRSRSNRLTQDFAKQEKLKGQLLVSSRIAQLSRRASQTRKNKNRVKIKKKRKKSVKKSQMNLNWIMLNRNLLRRALRSKSKSFKSKLRDSIKKPKN